MKKVLMVFLLAGMCLVGMFFCMMSIFGDMENMENGAVSEATVTPTPETMEKTEEELLREEAKKEAERFLKEYGMEIPLEEIEKQLIFRKEYEEMYGKSYPLEDVFLVVSPVDESEGDDGSPEAMATLDKIYEYYELYDIDPERYADLTIDEELIALELEYGPLPELTEGMSVEVDEAFTEEETYDGADTEDVSVPDETGDGMTSEDVFMEE